MIGKAISQYKILEKLGEGGMGVVYKAQDTKLDRMLALKFLPPHLTVKDEDKARFLQEAKAAAAINHPNVCTIYDIKEHEDPATAGKQQFIVMEFISGTTLRAAVGATDPVAHNTQATLQINDIINYTTQIAAALQAAHDKGIVHRDIKSDNIMVSESGQIKVMDFGLAMIKGAARLTKTSSTVGTLAYSSPEQIQAQSVDTRSDIWSLGVVMFELLTGNLPFSGEYESAIMYSILNEPPAMLTDFRNDLPEGIESIVYKSLMKNLNERYQNVSEIIADLVALKEGQKVKTVIPDTQDSPSIAVLPFTNMSNDPEQEYFCEGMSDEIINALTQVNGMHVVARTSAFSFKGKNADIREIGEKLNVNTVLEGSVRKSGNRLRIMAQLIKVQDGYHLWSERYDRELDDVFAIQDEISLSIVEKLKSELIGVQPEKLVERTTDNMEAYSLYLKGLHYRSRLSPDTQTKAVECFNKAIELDPGFARAYASLAGCYVEMTDIGGLALLSRDEAYPLVKEAVEKALSLDHTLSEAQVLNGLFKAIFEWDWVSGDRIIQEAIKQNPKDVYSLMWCTYFFWLTIRPERAIDIALKTESYDPLSSIAQYKVATSFYHAKKYDEAIKRYQHIIEVDENFFLSYVLIGFTYTDIGEFEKALKMYQVALNKFGRHWIILNSMAAMYGRWGKESEAAKLMDELKKLSEKEMINPSHFAWSTIALGDEEQALEYFEQAFENKDLFLIDALKFPWPEMEAIRKHPRMQAIMEKMNYKY